MSSRFRLALVSPYFPFRAEPYRGQTAYQTLRLMQDRAEIEVFSPIATYPNLRLLQPSSYRYGKHAAYEAPEDMKATYIEYPVVPVVSRAWNGWMCTRRVMDSVRRFQPDVILNYWLYPEGYAAVEIGRRLGVPVILGAIGTDVRRIPDAFSRFWTKRALRRADGLIAVSEELRQRSIELGARPESSFTIRNGCDTEIFRPQDRGRARAELGVAPEAEVVVFVGNLLEAKGMRELYDATVAVSARRPNLLTVVVGEGKMRAELEPRAAREGASERFRFAGRCNSTEVSRWMAAANLFCLPSYSEGCPNVLVEAAACGRAVVATSVGGIPEMVGNDTGVLVAPKDAGALARALEEGLSRAWDEESIARRSKRSWRDCADITTEICRTIMAKYSKL